MQLYFVLLGFHAHLVVMTIIYLSSQPEAARTNVSFYFRHTLTHKSVFLLVHYLHKHDQP